MPILPEDKRFLDEHNYNYELRELPGETILILKDYSISTMFDTEKVQVLIKIPMGYPMAQLDMFWVYPHVKLKDDTTYPAQADYFETYFSEAWQRFSRHYYWKPTYDLSTHLNVVKDVLVNGRG